VRVFAKKALEFKRYEEKDGQKVVAEKVTTTRLSFCDLPDWVKKDQMFKWASADGDIEIIQGRKDERAAELDASTAPTVSTKAGSKSKNTK